MLDLFGNKAGTPVLLCANAHSNEIATVKTITFRRAYEIQGNRNQACAVDGCPRTKFKAIVIKHVPSMVAHF